MVGAYYLLDTFTREKFKGNPTPVCILLEKLSTQIMHSFAKEFGAPVTAFIEQRQKDGAWPIRYFTVTGEIPACGHATLGAAFVMLSQSQESEVELNTIENVRLQGKQVDDVTFIEYPKFGMTDFNSDALMIKALGIKNYKSCFFCNELQTVFFELESDGELKQISPDFRSLVESSDQVKEVVVMCKSADENYDFIVRSFCPWIGIDEDPVTGSIHSVLGHFWQERTGKTELVAFQASERSGELFIKPLKNSVAIGGHAVIHVIGTLQ
jgi:PhzF family phenazine biosynthesis protein